MIQTHIHTHIHRERDRPLTKLAGEESEAIDRESVREGERWQWGFGVERSRKLLVELDMAGRSCEFPARLLWASR